MASLALFSLLVKVALTVTVLSPFILIILFIRDKRKGELW